MTESSFETRWHTVQNTWRSNAWLFGVFGYVLGILTLPAVQALTADAMAVLAGLVPETFGIIFTVFIIDRLYRNRETARQREEILKRVIREMRSPSAEEGARAADEARERGFLTDGSLRGANLRGAQLRKANLRGANLAGADLTEAVLAGAMLRSANLHGAALVHADLTAAKLADADLTAASLNHANLTRADLHNTTLTGAALVTTNLTEASLWGADLCSADMIDANLSGALLRDTAFDETTVLPDAPTMRTYSHTGVPAKRRTGKWTPDTDMARYTKPSHDDFWQPEWVQHISDEDNQPWRE